MKLIIQKSLVILLGLVFTEKVFSQAPVISYTTPQTYTAGTTITTLNVTNPGGAAVTNGQTSTLAGSGTAGSANGTGTSASFNEPVGVAVDASGNVFVADYGNNMIRKITPAGVVSTFAGQSTAGSADGQGTLASFFQPQGLAIDAAGNLYVADRFNNEIRKITPTGLVSTLAGNTTHGNANGTGAAASFYQPAGVAVDASGNVFVGDYGNNLVRKITPAGVVTTFAGSGAAGATNATGTAASFNSPLGLAFDQSGNLYVADMRNNMIRKITSAGVVTTLAGNTTAGFVDATGTSAQFNFPACVAADPSGNVYVADQLNNRIRKITSAGVVTTLSGNGTLGAVNGQGSAAEFKSPTGVGVDAIGNLYVGGYTDNIVRKVAYAPFTLGAPLPAGLSFNIITGAISGTPSAASAATAYSITAYNSSGTSTTSLNITVNPPAPAAINPTGSMNFITAYMPRVAGITTSTALNAVVTDKTQVQASIQYFDGLGRPVQSVQVKGSPTGRDIVQPIVYDPFEREVTKYLPYAVTGVAINDGSYKTTAVTDQGAFYTIPPAGVSGIPYPYSQTNLEASPLSRTLEQGAPGAAWQLSTSGVTGSGHTAKMSYTTNNSIAWATDSVNSMQVARYDVTINSNTNFSRTATAHGYYAANQLDVTVSKDENWVSGRAGTMETYTDKLGHVILKRVYNYTTSLQVLSTYYLYDDLGNLAFVLPPLATGDAAVTPTAITLTNLCYQYRYDARNRMSQKKIPGKGWEFMVYNIIDQPVASQDSLQRLSNNWIITKYDALGRTVLTGIWNNSNTAVSQPTLQGTLSAITTNLWEGPTTTGNGYTNVAWPTTSLTTTLGVNYYDSYSNIPGLLATYHLTSGVSAMTLGLMTAKTTAVLNTPTDVLWDVLYYDDLGRTITTYAEHYLGGTANTNNYDLTKVTYNFTNTPTTSTRQHFTTASTTTPLVTIANTYIYDHVGRKLKSWEQITNGTTATTKTLLSQAVYNEIGQLMTKQLHSTDSVNFFQSIAYNYNERGWLLQSTAPLFQMQLQYNTGANKQYNGNIAYQLWGTGAAPNTNTFTYAYDKLNRLTSGISADNYKEMNIAYDLMGNITALNRYQANTLIDQLTYTYTSGSNPTNQLQSINDATTSDFGLKHGTSAFTYDGNGNLKTDPSKGTTGITIAYNLLNLPQSITGSKTITYTYDASGQKLRRVSPVTNNTDYINGIQYDGTTTETLSFIQTEEGKAVPNGTGYDYEYYLGDNLGNARVTFGTKTGVAVLYQQDDYYPFGLEINRSVLSPKNEYLYNKKELQEELQEYDYGARFYDPIISRWNMIDPLAEKDTRWSPYIYGFDNAIRFEDPDGMQPCDPCDVPQDPHSNTVVMKPDGGYERHSNGLSEDHGFKLSSEDIETLSSAYNTAGTVVEGVGWLGAATGQEYLDPLIGFGAGMSATSGVVSGSNDIVHGRTYSGSIKLGTTFVFSAIGFKIDALKAAGKIETMVSKNILGITNFAASKIGDKVVQQLTAPKLAKNFDVAKSTKFAQEFFKSAKTKEGPKTMAKKQEKSRKQNENNTTGNDHSVL